MVGQGNLVHQMKNTSSHQLRTGRNQWDPGTPSTVQRSLVRSGLHGRVAAKKPYLQRGNKAKRLNYARKHRNWGAEKWQQVLWTDESKFEIFGCSRRQFVCQRAGERYNNECLQATVKHGVIPSGKAYDWPQIFSAHYGCQI